MIKSIHIKNFQSHKDSKLELHPGVNIIVGSSDTGKTAIIRALRWIAWNRPFGTAFRSYWGGETSVSVESDNFSVIRKKDKSDSYTITSKSSKEPLILKAFGREIPEEVTNTLKITPINLQQQMDSPFLLNESSGAVAAHFNKIAKLEVIDKATKNVDSWIRELSNTIKSNSVQISTQEEELSKLKNLEKLEALIEVLEDLEKCRNERSSKKSKLKALLLSIAEKRQEIESKKDTLLIEDDVNKVFALLAEKENQEKQKTKLNSLLQLISKNKENQEALYFLSAEEAVNASISLITRKKEKIKQRDLLQENITRITTVKKEYKVNEKNIVKLDKKFRKEMPAICPLCNK